MESMKGMEVSGESKFAVSFLLIGFMTLQLQSTSYEDSRRSPFVTPASGLGRMRFGRLNNLERHGIA